MPPLRLNSYLDSGASGPAEWQIILLHLRAMRRFWRLRMPTIWASG
jgi:hypothetical protein